MAGISRAQMVPPAACPLLLIGFSLGSVSFCVFLEVQRKGKWLRPLLMPDSSPVVLSRLTTMGIWLEKCLRLGKGLPPASHVPCHLVLPFPKYKLAFGQMISAFQSDRSACDEVQGRCERLRNEVFLHSKTQISRSCPFVGKQ